MNTKDLDSAGLCPLPSGLFPAAVTTAAVSGAGALRESDPAYALFPSESAHLSAAVPERRRQFMLGRRCARAALAQLGLGARAIAVGKRGEPLWPAGVVGSISHCDGFVGAAVARESELPALGFDVEPWIAAPPEVAQLLCTPAEWDRVTSYPDPLFWCRFLFSAKEAVYKCLYPAVRVFLDFVDVEIIWDRHANEFTARVPRLDAVCNGIPGRFAIVDEYLFTSAFLKVPPRITHADDVVIERG